MEIDIKKVMNLDLYKILNVDQNATDNEIRKAYKKGALKCHPDKHPDNPDAAALFVQLTQALEVLTDLAARTAYDNFLRAKQATEARHRQLESKRKRLKEDLEAREQAALQKATKERTIKEQQTKDAAKLLEQEIERLRKEGSRLVEEEQEKLRQEIKDEASQLYNNPADDVRLRVRWNSAKTDPTNGGYTVDYLNGVFSKYGEVTALLVSKKKNGSAIVEFASHEAAAMAVQNETGLSGNPLSVSWLTPPTAAANSTTSPAPSTTSTTPASCEAPASSVSNPGGMDFESLVLMRLRQAEERKRLAEQIRKEDEDHE